MYVYTYMYIYLVHVRTRFKKIDEQKGRKRETERARGNVIEREGMVHVAGREERTKRKRERERGNYPWKLGRGLVSSATRVSQPGRVFGWNSLHLPFAAISLSILSLSLPRAPYSPIPDQAYAPSSCHSIYQSMLV